MIYNTMYKHEYVDMTNSTVEVRALCIALGACHGNSKYGTHFLVPKWTNSLHEAHLNIERINYWIPPPPIDEYKVIDVFTLISTNKHNNLTEGIALGKFAHSFYGLMLYAANFRLGIENLLAMYDLNEQKLNLQDIFKITNFNKVELKHHPFTIHQRFRELLKFALLNQHMVAINLKEVTARLEKTIENVFELSKKEILLNFNEED